MDRNQAKALLPIIQAYAEGKTILVKDKRLSDEEDSWSETDDCSFNIEKFDYRIKPELKYRPFANTEECWNEMQKHQPFGWVRSKDDGSRALITLMISERDISINSISGLTMYELMEKFTFDDGAVFGILKEE